MTAAQGWTGMLDWLRRMRGTAPVHYDERTTQWHVFCHAEAQRVLADTETFSSGTGSPTRRGT